MGDTPQLSNNDFCSTTRSTRCFLETPCISPWSPFAYAGNRIRVCGVKYTPPSKVRGSLGHIVSSHADLSVLSVPKGAVARFKIVTSVVVGNWKSVQNYLYYRRDHRSKFPD